MVLRSASVHRAPTVHELTSALATYKVMVLGSNNHYDHDETQNPLIDAQN
jgi:hypothetical protein